MTMPENFVWRTPLAPLDDVANIMADLGTDRTGACVLVAMAGGRALSSGTIADRAGELLGRDFEVQSLKTQIKRLRAMGCGIRTVYGVGYQLLFTPGR
ncbi:hypothetical protein GCM10011360_17320 [Primorskyibacter flagellatus]|uniref:Uncharacterized protein n=1 Tax=Primorskyibacter flagellatus TaxID=1387277 RepID=A0A917A6J3_9RHOB|nr:helix-turn-helix domain-containing protein [Primorskyibacter flagellatus]GGE29783.1 hypothetical protein GCM10011360_17320 [Primorskyibacter flagellatus]